MAKDPYLPAGVTDRMIDEAMGTDPTHCDVHISVPLVGARDQCPVCEIGDYWRHACRKSEQPDWSDAAWDFIEDAVTEEAMDRRDSEALLAEYISDPRGCVRRLSRLVMPRDARVQFAVRVCQDCNGLLNPPVEKWEGKDCPGDQEIVVTTGICDRCDEVRNAG